MKNLLLIISICLLAISVTKNVECQNISKQHTFLLQDKDSVKYILNDSVRNAYQRGIIVNSPILAVDGIPFSYNQQQDTIYLPLKWEEIRYFIFLHKKDSHLLYGKNATNGAIIINTVYLK